jgi:hypothetical protein
MIDRTCCVCGEYVHEVWTLVIKDDKYAVKELSGHLKCVSELQKRINSIKNVHKMSVEETLKKIGYTSK